ncbi:hypothetical protein BKA81DRAFT_364515 [Phyllosticta paracitricarpa]
MNQSFLPQCSVLPCSSPPSIASKQASKQARRPPRQFKPFRYAPLSLLPFFGQSLRMGDTQVGHETQPVRRSARVMSACLPACLSCQTELCHQISPRLLCRPVCPSSSIAFILFNLSGLVESVQLCPPPASPPQITLVHPILLLHAAIANKSWLIMAEDARTHV